MGSVMITCPVTRKAIPTGVDTDLATLHQANPFRSTVLCPQCGQRHGWTSSDAWICDAVASAPPAARANDAA